MSHLLGKIPLLLRPLPTALTGVLVVAFSTALYSYQESFIPFGPSGRAVYLASLYLAIILLGSALVAFASIRYVAERARTIRGGGLVSIRPSSLLPYLLTEGRYRWYFVLTTVAYALFFSFLTGTLVYGDILPPFVDAAPPSVLVAACCGPPLTLPTVTIYLTGNLGLFLVPLTLILMTAISVLVGLNLALAAFTFHSRARTGSHMWVAGLGAIVGLFTGCPTCAGLFFGGLLGGVGAVSFATVLADYQPAFIAVSIPVLVATPYLISRSLSKVFTNGCVISERAAPSSPSR